MFYRMRLDHPFDHPHDLTGPVRIRLRAPALFQVDWLVT
jgi:hypothetical protein